MVGQLGQQIRTSQEITSDDIKGAVNSIIAAAKGKLQPDAVADIQKKLNSVSGSSEAPADNSGGQEQPMSEEVVEEENTDMMKTGLIQDLVRRAHLEHELSEFPEGLAFDIAEAIYVFIIAHNDGSAFIQELSSILKKSGFKAKHGLHGFDDLEQNGQAVYNALVKMEQDVLKPKAIGKPQTQRGFSLNETQKQKLFSKLK